MYFNPRIEAWLYKVTKTSSPEYKSELHATNGKKNGYTHLPTDDTADSESKEQNEDDEEKTDVEKGEPEKEKEEPENGKQEEEEASKDRKGLSGKQLPCPSRGYAALYKFIYTEAPFYVPLKAVFCYSHFRLARPKLSLIFVTYQTDTRLVSNTRRQRCSTKTHWYNQI